MRKLLTLFLFLNVAAFSLQTVPSITPQRCCPWNYQCSNPCAIGSLELGFHLLLFRPVACDWHFATVTQGDLTTPYELNPTEHPGVRLWAAYRRQCFEARLSWWCSRSTNTREVLRPLGQTAPDDLTLFGLPQPQGGEWDSALGRLRYSYSVVDLRTAQYLHRKRRCIFQAFANLRWVRMEQKMEIQATTDPLGVARLEERTSFNGVGVGVGLSGQYLLCDSLFIRADLGIMAIPGTLKMPRLRIRYDDPFIEENEFTEYNVQSCVAPGADARIALNYAWCYSRAKFNLDLGWEINQYWNILSPTESDLTVRDCVDVGFAGPFVGLGVVF